MSLERATTEIDRARAELDRVRASAAGWHDTARHKFDSQHLDPLRDVVNQLVASLKRAEQEIGSVLQSLGA